MIAGTGIDIIEIDRIRSAIAKHHGFIEKIFDNEEIKYIKERKMNVATIAGGFAAKEAVVKALGTGMRYFCWKEVRILRDEWGKPKVDLNGYAKEVFNKLGIAKIDVSISHCRKYAIAQAISIGGDYDDGCNLGSDARDR